MMIHRLESYHKHYDFIENNSIENIAKEFLKMEDAESDVRRHADYLEHEMWESNCYLYKNIDNDRVFCLEEELWITRDKMEEGRDYYELIKV